MKWNDRYRTILSVIFWLVSFVYGSVDDGNFIHYLNWQGATPGVIAVFFLVLLLSGGLVFAIYLRTRTKEDSDAVDLSERLFEENSIRTELTKSEIAKLKDIIRHERLRHPHVIFQSGPLFEKCVQSEVEELMIKNIEEEQIGLDELLLSNLRKKLGFGYLPLESPLLSTRNIEVGQKIAVFGRNHQNPLINKAVIVLNKELFFRIQFNPDKEDSVPLKQGDEIKIAFARRNDGVYGIPVMISRINGPSGIDCLHTMDLKRNQLRQYVRMDVNLPLRFRILRTESEERKKQTGVLMQAKMADISGGGLSFVFDKPLVPGDILSLNFQLSSSAFSGISGKVLRVSLQENKKNSIYRHHVQFTNIEPRNRDGIVKYVFEKQRQISQWR